jgi:two-component system cell cycle sensor histidine kinase/response regulator CckA
MMLLREKSTKLWLALLVVVFCAVGSLHGAEGTGATGHLQSASNMAPHPARVLILNSYHPRYVWADAVMRGISEVFLRAAPEVELRYEYLDAKHYRPAVVFEPMRQLLLAKYKRMYFNFDVIVSTDDDALDFLALYRDEIFPGTPVVFCGANTFEPGRLRGRQGFTGIVEDYDLRGTLELVLKLHPKARHWALVSGMSTSSLINQDRFYNLFPDYMNRIKLIDLARLNVAEMIEALKQLPEDTVIIYLSWYKMPDGTFLSVRESTSLVLQYGERPMYSPWDYTMGHGVIGGHVLKAAQHGSDAARIALRILGGTQVSQIPITRHSRFSYLFDWRMLRKFGISINTLPEPHDFINEPDTFYYRYKKQLWVVAGVFVYLLVTILALIRVIFQRKSVEADLRLNESRLEALLELNQTGDLALQAIVQMVLGKAVELTKSEMGFLFFLGDRQPMGLSCTVAENGVMGFHDLGDNTMVALGRTAVFKELVIRRAPVLIEAAGDLDLLQQHCFPADHKPVRHLIMMPAMGATTLQVVVGVGNKRSQYDGKDFRQLRLLLEGMLALIRSRRAKEREERLEAQLRQAQKMEAIGTFAGGIAHDFNNIIGGISSCTELAMDKLHQPELVREDLDQVLKAANRGKSLVRRILTFSRRKYEQIAPTDLHQVIRESMALVQFLMPENIEIVQELDDNRIMVMADSTQIQQVILNLCANAEQAMRGKNGVLRVAVSVVSIGPDEADLHPGLAPGLYARMLVADTGEGIAAELQPRIFEPFFTTRSHLGGTGLGLSTSHGIVTRHGGIITVHSIPGQGANFHLLLPLASEALPSRTPDPAECIRGGSEHLLLVDDDEVMRYALTRYLRSLGYSIRAFENGKRALSAFRKSGAAGFDLVVTDQRMPHMTGTALVQRIRKVDTRIPVILFSGFLSEDGLLPDPAQSVDLNIQCVLAKPFTNEQLAHAVRRVLDQAAIAGGNAC